MLDYYIKTKDLAHRVNNIIRFGVIKEVDLENNLVKVDMGDNLTTPFIAYVVNASGNAKVYFTPKEGDQVLLLSPNGVIANAVCMPNLYKGEVEGEADEWRLTFAKGSIAYKEGKLKINADTSVDITTKKANIKADQVTLSDDSGGGVVCQNHTCAFTGGPHPMGSSKVKGAQ